MSDLYQVRRINEFYTRGGSRRRRIEHGQELTVARIGRVKFVAHVISGGDTTRIVEWLDVKDKKGMIRSVRPDEIKRVHYKKKGWLR